MKLVSPNTKYQKSYLEGVREFQQEKREDGRKEYYEFDVEIVKQDFKSHIEEILSHSKGETVFWLIDNEEFIGRVCIRQELNDSLLKDGGHIGYDIRLSKRKMGYGKKILEFGLAEAKKLRIEKVLITCNANNIASKKVIESNGGKFWDSLEVAEGKPSKLRYWITL